MTHHFVQNTVGKCGAITISVANFIFSGQGINFMRKNNTGPLVITFIFDL
jgi:hypothetical protein